MRMKAEITRCCFFLFVRKPTFKSKIRTFYADNPQTIRVLIVWQGMAKIELNQEFSLSHLLAEVKQKNFYHAIFFFLFQVKVGSLK